MSGTRRRFFQDAAVIGAGLLGLSKSLQAQDEKSMPMPPREAHPGKGAATALLTMATPDLADLGHETDGNVKVFHLIAEPVKRKIAPFKTIDTWGYNGSCPGPTIQVRQGDRVRVVFENHLPESTSLHWHGLEIPIEQDGVPCISQKPVAPGEKYVYEFTVHQEGTFFYHAHSAMQEMMGQIGFFVAHPDKDYRPRVDHDYGLILQEWAVLPSNSIPNTAAMEFNWLTFNGVSAPMTTPLLARLGSRVRLRILNLGMDHHPDHLHGRRTGAGVHVVSDEHGAGGRGAGPSRGVRSEVPRRLDDPLPPAAPHDEQHDGLDARPADRDRRPDRGKGHGSDGITREKRAVRARASFPGRRKC